MAAKSAAGISEASPGDDVGLRQATLDSMAGEVSAKDDKTVPVSDSVSTPVEPAGKSKYPRVLPPEVEDAVGEAVREDTPG